MKARKETRRLLAWILSFLLCFSNLFSYALADEIEGISEIRQIPGDEAEDTANDNSNSENMEEISENAEDTKNEENLEDAEDPQPPTAEEEQTAIADDTATDENNSGDVEEISENAEDTENEEDLQDAEYLPEVELSNDLEMEADVIYDLQPATMEEVQAAIAEYEAKYHGTWEEDGLLTAAAVLKPHWEYEVVAELMPEGYHCELVDEESDDYDGFGALYYTFFDNAEEELLNDIEIKANVIYDPQPTTMKEVQAAIAEYEAKYHGVPEEDGLLAAEEVPKPHWEYEVAAELMPVDWHCELVDWDTGFGADYYTFFPNPMTMVVTVLLPGSTSADLQAAIDSATSGDVIEIPSDIAIGSTPIRIPSGLDITIQSVSGGQYELTQSNMNILHINVYGKLTLQDIILDGGDVGGGVYVDANGTLIMNDGTVIRNCTKNGNHAAVYVDSGNFDMNGGEIKSNACHGVFVMNTGNFNMYGGIIGGYNPGDGNTATNWGGGVGVYYGSNFTLYDGEIVGNTAEGGGGVFLYGKNSSGKDCSFTMKGGLIHGNQGTLPYYSYGGGGLLMWNGTFIMEGGAITGNTAYAGGGVCASSVDTKIYIYDGEISGNTAAIYGGGICASGMLELGDNTGTQAGTQIISGNTARYGGGIFADATSFTIGRSSGSAMVTPVIEDNTAYYSGGVYAGGSIVNMHNGAVSGNRSSYGGGLYISGGQFKLHDGEITNNVATDAFASHYPTTPANIGTGGGVTVTYSEFEMHNGTISGNAAHYTAGGVYIVYAYDQGTNTFLHSKATMYDGEISGNTANLNGGGVVVNGGGTFRMEGGLINDNGGTVTAGGTSYGPVSNGGGVFTSYGDFEMCGGEIDDNYAQTAGGGVYISLATLDPSNSGTQTIVLSNFTMGDPAGVVTGNPTISNNTSGDNGGGVYIAGKLNNGVDYISTFTVLSGTTASIINNSTAGNGGGIYTMDGSYMNLDIGATTVFSGNSATCYYTDVAASSYTNIQFASTSVSTHPLNNYDINYIGYPGYYSVTYDANGGSGTAPAKSFKAENETFPAAANTFTAPITGMRFKEWNTQSDGLGISYAQGAAVTMPAQALTLYAIWENISAYTLMVKAGTGGSVDVSVNGQYAAGSVITITATANSNYSFSRWTSNNDGSFADTSNSTTTFTMPAGNVTLTANFIANSGGGSSSTDEFSVIYSANGGTGDDHKMTGYPYGNKHIVLGEDDAVLNYSYDGYRFTGWNTKANGSGTNYSPESTLANTDNITLYAQWREKLITKEHISYLNIYPDGSVRADNAITRAEAASLFYRLITAPRAAEGNWFNDFTGNEWYAQAVNYIGFAGIMSGYPDGTFRPDAPITRAEFAALASQFDKLADIDNSVFSDVPDNHWAVGYIHSVYAKGWMQGYPDGTFRPEDTISRAEAVTIVNIMLNRRIDAEALSQVPNPYNDIARHHWAYADIIEASIIHDYRREDSNIEIWQAWIR